ncbi:SDR family NAD(P)-dependent oxidoreductase [Streptomyces sp. NPDC090088]|uniref:SDR family NAD(P)-dependent oxidoreductase n=1 Tax=Streptomyces sp. NPDC090088 TaxID=3365944 RepID=UPI003816363E
MSKTIAVLGAGRGLGASVARRFGAEGYQVALVARNAQALEAMVAELRADGVTTEAFPADLRQVAEIPGLLARIQDRLGPVEVLYFGATAEEPHTLAQEVTAEQVAAASVLHTFAPIEAVRAVLPGMLAAGAGSVLYGNAVIAIQTAPGLTGPVGPALAATRNWLQSLHTEVAPAGVYVGALYVAAMIDGSDLWEQVRAMSLEAAQSYRLVSGDELAEALWQMHTDRNAFEQVLPQSGAGA